ncbi:hypothetical protein BCR22_06380 [Enterococcus plantarum]|nr:hypothetical protein BCR22_06380 [Enterococcus plantarum]
MAESNFIREIERHSGDERIKAVPLRALIVKGKSNLSNLGGTAYVYSFALVFNTRAIFVVNHYDWLRQNR